MSPGKWSVCEGEKGPTEDVCDGLDNDCDGEIDEDCDCVHGTTEPCGTDTGECVAGERTCEFGVWSDCEGSVGPGTELCDGEKDENCDGEVDEGCGCINGETRPCGTDEGICELGEQTCNIYGKWGKCKGGIGPMPIDICNGFDDDCDGRTDPGCECINGETRPCGTDAGECKPGTQVCENGKWSEECTGKVGPFAEVCNDLDDDCNGIIDDDCGDVCVEVPFDTEKNVEMAHTAKITRADITFLVDVTGSMGEEIGEVRNHLTDTIIPGLKAAIPDVNMSVASFRDFPVWLYGKSSDFPFKLLLQSTNVTTKEGEQRVRDAVATLVADGGKDGPESQVEALYRLASGEGFNWEHEMDGYPREWLYSGTLVSAGYSRLSLFPPRRKADCVDVHRCSISQWSWWGPSVRGL